MFRRFVFLLVFLLVGSGVFLDVQSFSSRSFIRSTTTSRRIARVAKHPPNNIRSSLAPSSKKQCFTSVLLPRYPKTSLKAATDPEKDDALFDGKTTLTLVGGQALLIVAAIVAALILQTPNYGLGPGIDFEKEALLQGALCALPLFGLAAALEFVEEQVPALKDVSIATQRSVLALLGGTFKPALALMTSLVLGIAAGLGEEMLFRGVLQYELASRFGSGLALACSSLVFGALHAVTPLYAALATVASVYFGWLYTSTDNLAVPIVTHALYDLGALLFAHWTVTRMTDAERQEIVDWEGPTEPLLSASVLDKDSQQEP